MVESLDAILVKGSNLIKQHSWKDAVNLYKEAIKSYSKSHELYFCLGDAIRHSGDIDKAVNYYLKGAELNSSYREIWLRLFTLLRKKQIPSNKLEKIIQIIQILDKKLNKNLPSAAYHVLGDSLTKLGQVEEAIQLYKRLVYKNNIKSNPEYIKSYWDRSATGNPDFMIIGFAKCGTSSLHSYILKHPNVLETSCKEIYFFKDPDLYNLGSRWYSSHFPPIPNNSGYVVGEATPTYVLSMKAALEIHQLFPNTKFILVVRNPVHRVVSHHYYEIMKGKKYRDIEKSIVSSLDVIKQIQDIEYHLEKYSGYIPKASHISSSLYTYFLEKWMKIFSKEQFLLLRSEDLAQNPEQVMNVVFDFLSLPNYSQSFQYKKNKGSYPSISDNLNCQLSKFFKPHNERLEDYLGIKFDWEGVT